MSGSAEVAAGPDAAGGGRHGRRRGVWVGLVIGVIAVSGALVAVLQDSGGDDEPSPLPGGPIEPVEVTHEFPADYSGQVWITVTAADDAPRTVTIRWGPWERRFVHESPDPETYWFTKDPPQPGDENVPTTVRIEPGADVVFDQGSAPIGSFDMSTGWDHADETSGADRADG